MEGNRHNFSAFLHGAVLVLSVILGSFGILGYVRFGSDVQQMLNLNIPATSWVAFAVNVCVIVGVGLTFPLQIYPVVEMIEVLLFSHGKIFIPFTGLSIIIYMCKCRVLSFFMPPTVGVRGIKFYRP